MEHRCFTLTLLTSIITISLTIIGCGGGGGGGSLTAGFEGQALSDNPNFNLDVSSVVIGEDLRPAVTFTAVNDNGMIIPLDEFTDARFILAVLERYSVGSPFAYRSYSTQIETAAGGDQATQAAYDSARQGDIIVNNDGTYTYKFNTALPEGYDRTATHQLGGQFRYIPTGEDVTYRANIAFAFRPDGAPVTETREIVSTESCNKCHTRLSFHGDIRREVQLCILCHNPGSTDAETGNSLQFPELIHKIHRGAELPSFEIDAEPYQISGYRDSIHDYSTVHFPQDIRNCSVCHSGAPQAELHKTAPTLEGCASCHDRTWFGDSGATPASFTNHIGGVQNDNSLCALCHSPEGSGPAIVDIVHMLPTNSDDAPGLDLNVISVGTFAGVSDVGITITFTVENGDGTPVTDLAELISGSIAAIIAYPAPDYETYLSETITGTPVGTLFNNGDGSYDYTFLAELPTGSTDTFAVAMQGRRSFTHLGETERQGTAGNGQLFFTLDASTPIPRRSVVDDAKCSVCHEEIRMHGGTRTGTSLCVMCHNPNTTDEARRPAEEMPPVTVNFKDLIHRIHTGENLEQDYTVYGYGGSVHMFNEVRFPGERQECSICHEDGTTSIPLPSEAISTVVTEANVVISEVLETRAACTSCHDSLSANAHALVNTLGGVESCSVCHSDSDLLSVSNVHALAP